jgi:hypothetical protein
MNNYPMRTITLAYPGFQTLPRGVKKMLVVSESFFFGENDRSKTPHPQAVQIPVPIVQRKDAAAKVGVFENSDWKN